jgi:DNA-binding transcriptional MerR regulator
MNFDDVSYVGVPDDNECIVNAVQIGKQLDLPPHIIRSWADEFEEFLYIKKINGRMTYTQKSVEQFEWIKAMRDKGYGIKHIRDQLKLKGFTANGNELGIINPNDVNLMESIKTELGIEMKNQLSSFLKEFLANQEKNNIDLVANIKTEVEQTVQEQLEDSMCSIKKELELQREENKKLSNQLSSIQQEIAITQDINSKMDKLKESMEQRKKESEEQTQHQGFLSRLFNKKK